MKLHWNRPQNTPLATLIVAHGAGASMHHPLLELLAQSLVQQGLALVRFNFSYAQKGLDLGRRIPPPRQEVLLAEWRRVYEAVRQQVTGPIVLAGKSMGGRMASLLADELAVPALVVYGYPFHPIGKTQVLRTAHLQDLATPTLIIQGERDAFGSAYEVAAYPLSSRIALHWLADADHDFKPRKASGFCQEGHWQEAARVTAQFLRKALSNG